MKILLLAVLCLGVANCWPSSLGKELKCGLSESLSLFDQSISKKSEARKDELIFMTEFARFMNYKAPHLLQEFSQRKKLSEGKEKLQRRHFQTEFKDTLRKLDVITKLLVDQKRQKRSDKGTQTDGSDDKTKTIEKRSIDIEARQNVIIPPAVTTTTTVAPAVVTTTTVAPAVVTTTTTPSNTSTTASAVSSTTSSTASTAPDSAQIAGDLVGSLIGVLTDGTDTFIDVVASVGDALQASLPPTVWNAMCVATWWPLQEAHCSTARCVVCAPSITTAASVCKNTGLGISHKCLEEVMDEGFCNYCIKEYLQN